MELLDKACRTPKRRGRSIGVAPRCLSFILGGAGREIGSEKQFPFARVVDQCGFHVNSTAILWTLPWAHNIIATEGPEKGQGYMAR
jgi:hypothetical protein